MLHMDYEGKKVTVVGLAKSGIGAANLLSRLGAKVTVTDIKGKKDLELNLKELKYDITLVLGEHPNSVFEEADLIVLSPGVPMYLDPIQRALKRGIEVIGELELAYRMIITYGESSKILSITGTNGKSTATSLLYNILRDNGFQVIVGGNIGYALTEIIYELINQGKGFQKDYYVTEVSSFQLESIRDFRPFGSTILNITPDHLDRYDSMSSYIDAKCRIFLNQTEGDFLVLNADDPATNEILFRYQTKFGVKETKPEIFYFSRKKRVEGAYYLEDEKVINFYLPSHKIAKIKTNLRDLPKDFCLRPQSFKIRGVHNIENVMAVSLMALLCGSTPETISNTLRYFAGLEHRLEFVRDLKGVVFINDSKGTNVGAVMKSLESFESPIILIAGGRDKHSDFGLLRPFIKGKVKALILIGEAKEKIRKAVGDLTEVFIENDMDGAVKKAYSIAVSGDVVLLSPACASFDMFENFEDRGRKFKKAVWSL
ncbi:MAG: UDP-N-acetylmuramoyl-L-alanine--D-glutamate ligase [Thermodesulfovibrionales bacterium]|nr:UDP-N-acetylmuramoyl-L-alanine--D-glutamate ligase [Thermodesulfovibrionales bacterium]